MIADFLPDKIVLRFFKWDLKTQTPEAIDTLERSRSVSKQFHTFRHIFFCGRSGDSLQSLNW